tara:strand:- start:112 stop:252 length:141 start_codon:yes stop_codon:yes gene_type:complete
MNKLLIAGLLVDIGIVIGGINIVKQLQKNQTRQPALSKRIIRNLKF